MGRSVYRQYAQAVGKSAMGGAPLRITMDRDAEHEAATRESLGRGWGRVPVFGVQWEYAEVDGTWEVYEVEVIVGPLKDALTVFTRLVDGEIVNR